MICAFKLIYSFKNHDYEPTSEKATRDEITEIKARQYRHLGQTASHQRHHFLHDQWKRRLLTIHGCTQKHHHPLTATQKTHLSLYHELCQVTPRSRHPWSQYF